MNPLEYLKRLLPSFKKNQIVASCNLTQTSLREHTLPAYASASALFKGRKFKSKAAQDFATVYAKQVQRGPDMVGDIYARLTNALVVLTLVADKAEGVYAEVEANLSMTYVKLTYLRLVESAEFANTYARKLLNYLFILETGEADEHFSVQDALTKAEVKWLDECFLDFCMCLEFLGRDVKSIEKQILEMPEATINALSVKVLPSTIGDARMDPFQMKRLSAAVNPFYFFGMLQADRQNQRYKSAKEELELLQLRKLNLEKLYDKSPDAQLQRDVESLQGRVEALNFEVIKAEKEYLHG